jgi:hypothetical protein
VSHAWRARRIRLRTSVTDRAEQGQSCSFVCLIKHYAISHAVRCRSRSATRDSGTKRRAVASFTSRPLYPPVTIGQDTAQVPELLRTLWKTQSVLTLTEWSKARYCFWLASRVLCPRRITGHSTSFTFHKTPRSALPTICLRVNTSCKFQTAVIKCVKYLKYG